MLNQDDAAQFIEDGLANQGNIALLGGIGVDLDAGCGSSVQTEPVTFLLAARLLREKGIVEYAEAARKIKAEYIDAQFVLLGALDTNPSALAHNDIDAWVLEGLLEWPGHVIVEPWLERASVFVLPFYREGVPRSTHEAMAMAMTMGRAIITTDAPGCRETVVDGVNGYLVPVRDVDALVLAMARFLDNPERIAAIGLDSRRMAAQKFDVQKIDARLVDFFGPAMNQPLKRLAITGANRFIGRARCRAALAQQSMWQFVDRDHKACKQLGWRQRMGCGSP